MPDNLKAALETNYNPTGVELIEELYQQDNFLSLSGEQTTDELARLAGIGAETSVLDIGCGLGGPAMRLADRLGCQIVGVDLVASNVEAATERVAAAGLADRVSVRQGDALDLPFEDRAFDVVWSQDAWCHVPDKAALVQEAARMVRPGGCVAFADWVETAPMQEGQRDAVLDALSAPNFETMDGYQRLLEDQGLVVEHRRDISERFAARYDNVMERLHGMEDAVTERFSPRVFRIMVEKNGIMQDAFNAGQLGGCEIVARRPGV